MQCQHRNSTLATINSMHDRCENPVSLRVTVLNKPDMLNTERYLCMWHAAKCLETNVLALGWEVKIKSVNR